MKEARMMGGHAHLVSEQPNPCAWHISNVMTSQTIPDNPAHLQKENQDLRHICQKITQERNMLRKRLNVLQNNLPLPSQHVL